METIVFRRIRQFKHRIFEMQRNRIIVDKYKIVDFLRCAIDWNTNLQLLLRRKVIEIRRKIKCKNMLHHKIQTPIQIPSQRQCICMIVAAMININAFSSTNIYCINLNLVNFSSSDSKISWIFVYTQQRSLSIAIIWIRVRRGLTCENVPHLRHQIARREVPNQF